MHELSIAVGILDMVEEEMRKHEGAQLDAVILRIGALSGVVKEALLSAYELAREQSAFANSQLILEDVPIAVFCLKCNAERPVHSVQDLRCTECDTPASEVLRGRELEVAALELME
jgi:hydrogenase nickel incorporation protein HypA/HybF